MKVLIINQHTNNFGDEAAGTALINELLTYKKIDRIDVIYNSNSALNIQNPKVYHRLDLSLKKIGLWGLLKYLFLYKVFPNKSLNYTSRELINTIRNADIVFVAPSGANIGIYTDWRFLFRLFFVYRERKNLIFHLNTIGKSKNKIFDKIALKILKSAKLYVREKRSQEYLKGKGLSSTLGYDTAFLLPTINSGTKENIISFVPSELSSWHPEFKNSDINFQVLKVATKQIAKFCIENNLKIQILPHLRTSTERSYNLMVIKELCNCGLPKEKIVDRLDIKTFEDYDEAIAKSQIVIGMRYHSIVLAAKNNVAFLSLCYENKMKEVCEYTDMERFSLDLQKKENIEKIEEKLNLVFKNKNKIEKKLKYLVNNKIKEQTRIVLKQNL